MFDFYGMGYGNEYNIYEPMANNGIMGVYTQNTQISINLDQLLSLGFTLEEINTLNYIIMCNGKVTQSALVSYGLPYETAQKIKYMYDIATGKISINSTDDLVNLRKTLVLTEEWDKRLTVKNTESEKLSSWYRRHYIPL